MVHESYGSVEEGRQGVGSGMEKRRSWSPTAMASVGVWLFAAACLGVVLVVWHSRFPGAALVQKKNEGSLMDSHVVGTGTGGWGQWGAPGEVTHAGAGERSGVFGAGSVLSLGWKRHDTSDGKLFYADQLTGASQWQAVPGSKEDHKMTDAVASVPSDRSILSNRKQKLWGILPGLLQQAFPQPVPPYPSMGGVQLPVVPPPNYPYLQLPSVPPPIGFDGSLAPLPPVLRSAAPFPYMVQHGTTPTESIGIKRNKDGSQTISIKPIKPMSGVVWLPHPTADPTAAPWGSSKNTASFKLPQGVPEVDLVAGQGPSDEPPQRIVGSVAGLTYR